MGLLAEDGTELPTRVAGEAEAQPGTRVLLLTEAEQRFVFEDVAGLPTPSLLRGFSAPVKLSGISLERLQFLAAHDSDPFVRWESGQQYTTQALLREIETWRPGAKIEVPDGIVAAAVATLRGAPADPAFAAEALVLPSETFLADQMAVADPDAIHAVREAARAAIGAQLTPILQTAYDQLTDNGDVPDRRRGDRPARAAQCLPRLYRRGRAEARRDTGKGAIRYLAEHDRCSGGTLGAEPYRLPAAQERAGQLL